MVAVNQGEIWWADLSEPVGSVPGYMRPMLVIQGDRINRSRISTVICIPLTSNLEWAHAPGNIELAPGVTGLRKDSVVNVSQIITVDRSTLVEKTGKLPAGKMRLVFSGIDVMFGRSGE
jgi:mRNA interferase MazF